MTAEQQTIITILTIVVVIVVWHWVSNPGLCECQGVSLSVNYIHSPCFFEEGLEFLALWFQPPECWDGLIPPDLTRDTF